MRAAPKNAWEFLALTVSAMKRGVGRGQCRRNCHLNWWEAPGCSRAWQRCVSLRAYTSHVAKLWYCFLLDRPMLQQCLFPANFYNTALLPRSRYVDSDYNFKLDVPKRIVYAVANLIVGTECVTIAS